MSNNLIPASEFRKMNKKKSVSEQVADDVKKILKEKTEAVKKPSNLTTREALEQVILFCELDEATANKARFVLKQLELSGKI